MLFFLNLDGTVTRSDTDHVYQGQNKVTNVELFTLISPAQAALQVAFTLPNGLTTTYAPMSYVGAYSVDESNQKQVRRWKLAVPYNVTEVEGQVGVSFNVLLNDGTSGETRETINQTTYTSSFTVEYSALPIPPTTATEDELGQILDLLDKYYAQNASLAKQKPFVVGTVETTTFDANQQASVAVEQSTTPDGDGNYPTNFAFGVPKGTTFTPSVDDNGNISWSNDGGKANPATKNIKGVQGNTGATPDIEMQATVDENVGTPSVAVEKSGTAKNPKFTLAFSNIKGEKGETIKSIESYDSTENVTYTKTTVEVITSDDNKSTFDVSAKNGTDALMFVGASNEEFTVGNEYSFGNTSEGSFNRLPNVGERFSAFSVYDQYGVFRVTETNGGWFAKATCISVESFRSGLIWGEISTSSFMEGSSYSFDRPDLYFSRPTVVGDTFIAFSEKSAFGLFEITAASPNVSVSAKCKQVVSTKGTSVIEITSGKVVDGFTTRTTPVTFTLSDGTQTTLLITAKNGKDGSGDVVQETGQSTTAVMSQKAVTDELAKKATTSEVNAKYTKPSEGIPKSDLSQDVQDSLDKADTALQSAPVTSVNGKTGDVQLAAEDVGALPSGTKFVSSVNGQSGAVTGLATTEQVNAKYTKPSGGIPKSDLSQDVQDSLDKADTALQQAPVTSVNGKTGVVTINTTNARAELVTIATTDWVADSTIAPFAYKAAKTLTTYNMGGYDAVSMGYAKNADLLVGATAGIAIGEVPTTLSGGKNITFYSVAQPTAQVQIVVYLETISVQGID